MRLSTFVLAVVLSCMLIAIAIELRGVRNTPTTFEVFRATVRIAPAVLNVASLFGIALPPVLPAPLVGPNLLHVQLDCDTLFYNYGVPCIRPPPNELPPSFLHIFRTAAPFTINALSATLAPPSSPECVRFAALGSVYAAGLCSTADPARYYIVTAPFVWPPDTLYVVTVNPPLLMAFRGAANMSVPLPYTPFMLALAPAASMIYVSFLQQPVVAVYDMRTLLHVVDITVPVQAALLVPTPDATNIYVLSPTTSVLTTLRFAASRMLLPVATLPAGEVPVVAVLGVCASQLYIGGASDGATAPLFLLSDQSLALLRTFTGRMAAVVRAAASIFVHTVSETASSLHALNTVLNVWTTVVLTRIYADNFVVMPDANTVFLASRGGDLVTLLLSAPANHTVLISNADDDALPPGPDPLPMMLSADATLVYALLSPLAVVVWNITAAAVGPIISVPASAAACATPPPIHATLWPPDSLYVGSADPPLLSVFYANASAAFPLPDTPFQLRLAPLAFTLYVSFVNLASVAVYDMRSLALLANISVATPANFLVVTADAARLFVFDGGSSTIAVVDGFLYTMLPPVVLPAGVVPNAAAAALDCTDIYIATASNVDPYGLYRFHANSLVLLRTFDDVVNLVAVAASSVLVSIGTGLQAVIYTSGMPPSSWILYQLPSVYSSSLAFMPDANTLFLFNSNANLVTLRLSNPNAVSPVFSNAFIPDNPSAILLNADASGLFVQTFPNIVSLYNITASPVFVNSFVVPGPVVSYAVAPPVHSTPSAPPPDVLYILSTNPNRLTIVNGSAVSLPHRPLNLLVAPLSSSLFVSYASQPFISVFNAISLAHMVDIPLNASQRCPPVLVAFLPSYIYVLQANTITTINPVTNIVTNSTAFPLPQSDFCVVAAVVDSEIPLMYFAGSSAASSYTFTSTLPGNLVAPLTQHANISINDLCIVDHIIYTTYITSIPCEQCIGSVAPGQYTRIIMIVASNDNVLLYAYPGLLHHTTILPNTNTLYFVRSVNGSAASIDTVNQLTAVTTTSVFACFGNNVTAFQLSLSLDASLLYFIQAAGTIASLNIITTRVVTRASVPGSVVAFAVAPLAVNPSGPSDTLYIVSTTPFGSLAPPSLTVVSNSVAIAVLPLVYNPAHVVLDSVTHRMYITTNGFNVSGSLVTVYHMITLAHITTITTGHPTNVVVVNQPLALIYIFTSRITVYNAITYDVVDTVEMPLLQDDQSLVDVNSAALSADGRHLYFARSNTVRASLFDMSLPCNTITLRCSTYPARPAGNIMIVADRVYAVLVSDSVSTILVVYNPDTQQCASTTFPAIRGPVYRVMPDANTVFFCSLLATEQELNAWNTSNPGLLASNTLTSTSNASSLVAARFSADAFCPALVLSTDGLSLYFSANQSSLFVYSAASNSVALAAVVTGSITDYAVHTAPVAPTAPPPAAAVWATAAAVNPNAFWTSVAFGDSTFVAVGTGGEAQPFGLVMTSPNGSTWAEPIAPVTISVPGDDWSVAFGDGLFVAVSVSGTVKTSPTGTVWTIVWAAPSAAWTAVAFGNGIFVAVANGGQFMTSLNGLDWPPPGTVLPAIIGVSIFVASGIASWSSVAFGIGIFVAVSDNGFVVTIADGSGWEPVPAAPAAHWNAVAYGDGTFVAVANGGQVMTSPNGTVWTIATAALSAPWSSVAFGNSTFVAVASSGQVMTSYNGPVWAIATAAPSANWRSVAFGEGVFVAVGDNGAVMTSAVPIVISGYGCMPPTAVPSTTVDS